MADMTPQGLGGQFKSSWPKVKDKDLEKRPIDRLVPGSELHKTVLTYLLQRVSESERKMSLFYDRWSVNEKQYQAYIDLPKWDKVLRDMNATGAPPQVVNITVPYSFATISTIVTYLIHTFAGRRPMFQVGSTKKEGIQPAQMMETVLQFNADYNRIIKLLFQFLMDGQQYGVSVMRCQWEKQQKLRTVWKSSTSFAFGGIQVGQTRERVREMRTTYEGNILCNIDPYMFLPDPRVPMVDVARRGEYVFWRSFEGRHYLLQKESEGKIKWVNHIGAMPSARSDSGVNSGESARSLVAQGEAQPGRNHYDQQKGGNQYVENLQGTITIIPAELGLGKEETPQKWIFSIGNRGQIIQAEPLELDHDMHPVIVSEPYTQGYGFGQPGMSDYLGPFQNLLSWFINSHMDNVKTALNNMWLVDPSKVEIQDLKRPGPGKLIRLKRSAYGSDVRQAVQQLGVVDVTSNHPRDFELLMRMADTLSSVTDNLRGLQDSGGRKTATEVRTSGEAAASRLAALARLISAQALVDLAEQMSMNIQQYLDEEFYLQIVGEEGKQTPIQISPEMLVGEFNYPIHDGTLPLDRVAMLDVWKEVLIGTMQDPQLRSTYDFTKIFEYVADLGGAKNLSQFRVNMSVAPDEAILGAAAAGNAIPMENRSPTPGVQPNPGDRMAGQI